MPGKDETGVVDETPEKGSNTLSDEKPCSRVVEKKMVQACLPFKRLNPAPREKGTISQRMMPHVVQNVNTGYPFDVENGCNMDTGEAQPIPKMVNGRGPLDNYIRKISKTCNVIPITIDLTEDTNSELVDKPPSKGKVQYDLTDVLPSCDLFRSPSCTQIKKNPEDCLEQMTQFTAKGITEGQESPNSVELQATNLSDSVTFLTSPVGEHTEDEDEDTPVSSNSSPFSSPDALPTTLLNSGIKSASPTSGCKEKEQQSKRPKLQTEKEHRDRIREESKLAKERAKEEAKKKRDEEREQKAKEKKEKKEKDDREKAEKMRLKEEKKKEKLEALE
ncbi:chromatin assembly factor 1 subunit A-B-like [Rana temporaria]|uniref:chromatin assembly factor 1 subunit A-B-like n=1 Tax=Rana temporaria TaxID=8407 RepID=UPI001AADA834|nr:chromatin assembly factor 1 subunit A-B-like [Rana temporaria]